MPIHQRRARILTFPKAETLRNARLDNLTERGQGERHDLLLDYHELRLRGEPDLLLDGGIPAEHVLGDWVPRRLRFAGLTLLNRKGLFSRLDTLPADHPVRSVRGALYWQPPGQPAGQAGLFLLIHGSDESATLILSARKVIAEKRAGETLPADFIRRWSSAPLLKPGLVPAPLKLHQRRGGDPVAIHLDGRAVAGRLFVGGLEEQPERRPEVDFVLNLGEDPSRWAEGSTPPHPADRWILKGEGSSGMNWVDLAAEAQWVIERLRAGQCGLVHCSAGFNRSVTVCCAVLILLEGLSAEAALERVREHHPWARPDAHHWLALRWLAASRPRDLA